MNKAARPAAKVGVVGEQLRSLRVCGVSLVVALGVEGGTAFDHQPDEILASLVAVVSAGLVVGRGLLSDRRRGLGLFDDLRLGRRPARQDDGGRHLDHAVEAEHHQEAEAGLDSRVHAPG